ncbi:MAG TPA: GntR family transcriptional regulator [Micromonosporaceae bacterium]|jgi:DNA-binding transcriptional regulator YhcF (GntR family)
MPYDPGPLPEPWAPDDPRVLFQRVVDDILTKIETGELYPNARLPSARKMAEQYGVGVMTIQRALRELQQMRITYSVAGKGTFIHPDFADLSTDAPLRDALADPATLHQLGEYLRQQQAILASRGTTARDKTTAGRQLYDHAQAHRDLLDRIAQAMAADRAPYREL